MVAVCAGGGVCLFGLGSVASDFGNGGGCGWLLRVMMVVGCGSGGCGGNGNGAGGGGGGGFGWLLAVIFC